MIDILTSNEEIKTTENYKKIKKLLSRLSQSGMLTLGAGYCVSVSDMIYTALMQQGIPCKMVECSLTSTDLNHSVPDVRFIGFGVDNVSFNPYEEGGELNSQVPTHVVVITLGDNPMLIDASITHLYPNIRPVVLDKISMIFGNDIIADFEYKDHNIKMLYKQKKNSMLPSMYQTSIVDRIITDRKIFDQIAILKKLNYIGIGLSLFAVIAVINQIMRWFV